jgi:NAD+ synthase (glutamine-hydrolysing)
MVLDPKISIDAVHALLIAKIRRFFADSNASKAVLGLSGGVDSALVLALAAEALGPENVHGIMMPSKFSTRNSVTDAEDLSELNGVKYDIIHISRIYERYMDELQQFFADGSWTTAQENLQARIRANILMAYSNRSGTLLLNTSNKSELSVGYGTIYGDLCGALMVIGDLYKLQVYDLCKYMNAEKRVIPDAIMTKAPSAELHPGQKDSDSIPDYSILDPILFALNEEAKDYETLLKAGVDGNTLTLIANLRKRSTFKTLQVPPVLQISSRPLLPDFKCF